MRMETAEYKEIRHILQPGALVCFGGTGSVSFGIKVGTWSPVSHCGIIAHVDVKGDPETRIHVVEATRLGDFAGVVSTPLSKRVKQYGGQVWVLCLTPEKQAVLDENLGPAWAWIDERVEQATAYDTWGAVRCQVWPQWRDYSKLFCSETAAGFLRKAKVLPASANPSAYSPQECASAPIWAGTYYQLKGSRKEIPRLWRAL